jgi:hypothetical protein
VVGKEPPVVRVGAFESVQLDEQGDEVPLEHRGVDVGEHLADALAVETLEKFLEQREQAARRKPLTIDFRDPALQGGSWLNEIRRAAERLRRAARKAMRKAKPKN